MLSALLVLILFVVGLLAFGIFKGSIGLQDEGLKYKEGVFFGSVALKASDFLLVLFTALLFVATAALYIATEGLVQGENRSSEINLRAYVNVHHVAFNPVTASSPAKCSIYTKNYGKTPASSVKVLVSVAFSELGDKDEQKEGTSAILIGDNGLLTAVETSLVATPERAIAVGEGRDKVVCAADISYTDVFGVFRHTSYKVIYSGGVTTVTSDGNAMT